jgi:glutamate synthase domain-containing protein 2
MSMMYIVLAAVLLFVIYDIFNRKHTIKSNFPIIGRIRYFLESIGPEMRQYLVAANREELPFNRVEKSYIYASSKGENNLIGFGSDADFNKPGHFFIKTAALPVREINIPSEVRPTKIIGPNRKNPYHPQSIVNISGMSYGALGKRATEANNRGADIAHAYHNTGEGGYSPDYHGNGADVVFNLGTSYFGCGHTNSDGTRAFDLDILVKLVKENPNIKMIEVKLSQGAKPGKGGVLPGDKVTEEIAKIRGIEVGKDVISPAYHSAFDSVDGLVSFVEEIAEATGLPVGIKSAVGKSQFWVDLACCMRKRGEGPDFITIDGGEGGTGAAPASFADNMSLPFYEAFTTVYKIFKDHYDVDKITWIASGKLGLPSKAVVAFAMGADLINIAREVMISAGCIQAQKCHIGNCPAGIATHKWWLEKGFDVEKKSERVGRFIKTLRKDILQHAYACGYNHPSEFKMEDIVMCTNTSSRNTLKEIYGYEK